MDACFVVSGFSSRPSQLVRTRSNVKSRVFVRSLRMKAGNTDAAETKGTTTAAVEEVPKGMPMQQGSVPIQSGAQADMYAYKKVEVVEEEKLDPIEAARREIEELTGETNLTEEQILRIKRMKKKVTRAAAVQESMGFADAWSKANAGRFDIWFWIGLIFLLTPPAIILWGVNSGYIPLE